MAIKLKLTLEGRQPQTDPRSHEPEVIKVVKEIEVETVDEALAAASRVVLAMDPASFFGRGIPNAIYQHVQRDSLQQD